MEGEVSTRISLETIARALAEKPFKPHPLLTDGHAQTLAGYAWPRRSRLRSLEADEQRLFEVEPGVRLLAHCCWHEQATQHPTLILLHGLEGSSASIYMLGTADKAYKAGFNVLRLNHRNCGGTEHLTPTLYHSGMTGDIAAVVQKLIEEDGLRRIYLAGFSMSGNMALSLLGQRAETMPEEVVAACAVSPSVDLKASVAFIDRRANWIYRQSFVSSLRRRMRLKKGLYPDLYDTSELHRVRTIRDFDERFTAIYGGFANADDYYTRTSSLPLIRRIRIPTLIIHAQDDPFIPYQPLTEPSIRDNPNILLLAPEHGGHVGFIAAESKGEDRFWAENRLVQFCQLIEQQLAP